MPRITTIRPTDYDVVFGRGATCNLLRSHNAYYRALLSQHFQGYSGIPNHEAAAKRSFIRTNIIDPIIDHCPSVRGRFLTYQQGHWWEYSIDDPEDSNEVEKTISQALRDTKKRFSPPSPNPMTLLQLTPSMPPAWQPVTATPTPVSATVTAATHMSATPTTPAVSVHMQQLNLGVITSMLVAEATDLSLAANRDTIDLQSLHEKLDTVKKVLGDVEREVAQFAKEDPKTVD